ncbi:putative bifunctional diguanylate cyclase/phosphodiesterase [Acidihalobacter ferrooxydans]|uniref:GGDEF-domain containing protein n=1 Tax=Acidihalobacter ferrooxydans TaxID=1765967 RepID=A0A1P8UED7_9GAMM|nr:bifunctional diguanylate cyclase/phosphodiesterase [Acidihalobacter ferrooxydans]APZ42158.1 hypothetical protein BW247_02820 [Acidihalobacter ferrooxydans]
MLALAESAREPPPPQPIDRSRLRVSPVVDGLTHLIERTLTDLEERDQEIRRMGEMDALTDLPNRHLISRRLRTATLRAARSNTLVMTAFIGLDHFKLINDSLGHDSGDWLLNLVARRLEAASRQTEVVGRFGSDVFILVAEGIDRAHTVQQSNSITQRILDALRAPFAFNKKRLHIGASMGIVLTDGAATSPQTAFSRADSALFAAKAAGRGRIHFFDTQMQGRAEERLDIETRLRRAIGERRLHLALQPQVDSAGAITGAEALIRISGDEPDWMSAASFIPVAEDCGLIVDIGQFVIAEAGRILADWARTPDSRDHRLSINASVSHFQTTDFVDRITEMLNHHALPGGRLRIELTEAVFALQGDTVKRTMQRLRELGVGISLDDFGTGYSSLAYLREFPIDEIKIDQSFVRSMLDANVIDRRLIEVIIDIGKTLQVDVIAEGVETQAHWDRLKAMGCRYFQGYFFGRPMLYRPDTPMSSER